MTSERDKSQDGRAPHETGQQGIRLLIDLLPLAAFFATYAIAGLYWATGVLVVATLLAVLASWLLLRHVSIMLIFTAVLVGGFGLLTVLLGDPRFIKMKPTIANLLLAGAILGGLALGKPVLKLVLGSALKLSDAGWSKLSVRWALYFIALAVLNEIIWRSCPDPLPAQTRILGLVSVTCSETTWVNFKAYGILLLTLVFSLTQLGLIRRHELPSDDGGSTS